MSMDCQNQWKVGVRWEQKKNGDKQSKQGLGLRWLNLRYRELWWNSFAKVRSVESKIAKEFQQNFLFILCVFWSIVFCSL